MRGQLDLVWEVEKMTGSYLKNKKATSALFSVDGEGARSLIFDWYLPKKRYSINNSKCCSCRKCVMSERNLVLA